MDIAKKTVQRLIWWMVFSLSLTPAAILLFNAISQNLGADPAKEIVLELGTWAINFLWCSLAVTPVRKLFGWRAPLKYRRMLGLYCYFYATLHLLAFATFMIGWDLQILLQELTERPYAVVGFIALLLLTPLAITSTKSMQRRLKKNWLSLHKLVYIIAVLVLLHIVWQVRSDFSEALWYGLLLSWLLAYRYYKKAPSAKGRATKPNDNVVGMNIQR
ncbi:MAG: sulfoxide reductase heme-binding subunit YedZ [Pseudomonadales bacterium]|nr:sulfoxide reductase heme-binding subunit YedZ [Pseudomonadales bacterium]